MVRRGPGLRAGLGRPGPLHLPRRHRPGRLRAAVGLDLALRRPGLDPACRDGQWYCHLFAREQPDLNWDNPEVRDDFRTTLRFWADRGVDGYRVDVAHALAKDLSEPLRSKPTLGGPDVPLDGNDPLYDRNEVHEIYAEWREVFDEYDPPRTAVAEAFAPLGAPRPLRPADRARPGVQLRPAQGRLRRRPVPRRDHLLPERGGPRPARPRPGCCPTTTWSGTPRATRCRPASTSTSG